MVMDRFRAQGVLWEVKPELKPHLRDVLDSPGQVVKESPFKKVTSHTLPHGTYYIKRYLHSASRLRPLKFYWKASQARQEWELAKRCEALDLPVVKHLALGERWSKRGLLESLLLTEGFPGIPVFQLPNASPRSVMDLLDRFYDRGLLQPDLHPSNILVNPDTGELRIVDLHGMRSLSRVTPSQRKRNLATLNVTYPIPIDAETQRLSRRLRRKIFHKRSARCLKSNREFASRRCGRLTWHVRLPWSSNATQEIVSDPDAFLRRPNTLLKEGRSATVGGTAASILKRHNTKSISGLIKSCFRHSRARRAFRKAYHLELTGIPTARPIAVAERKKGPLVIASYFLMEAIHGAVPLPNYQGDLMQAVSRTAVLIGRLHEEGFKHRDLKATNILIDSEGRPYLIDLDGLQFVGEVSDRQAGKDLLRLNRAAVASASSPRPIRLQFIKQYCKTRELRPGRFIRRPQVPYP